METQPNSQPTQSPKQPSHLPLAIISVILSGLIFGLLGYWYGADVNTTPTTSTASPTSAVSSSPVAVASPSPSATTATLTNDQIFREVATQLGLTRDGVGYFRIFGQDKVQYDLKLPSAGANFAYKVSGVWKLAQSNASSVADCNSLANVPVNDRPVCIDATGATLYMTAGNQSVNYLPSAGISYIGE